MDNHDNKAMSNIDALDASAVNPKSKQRISWAVLGCLIFILIVIILNQTGSLRNVAKTLGSNVQKRDLSTPSSRLVGHWVPEFYGHELYFKPVNRQIGTGTYLVAKPTGVEPTQFKILSEDSTGTELVIREFNFTPPGRYTRILGPTYSTDTKYHVAKDGKSMCMEISVGENHWLIVYAYVDDKTCP